MTERTKMTHDEALEMIKEFETKYNIPYLSYETLAELFTDLANVTDASRVVSYTEDWGDNDVTNCLQKLIAEQCEHLARFEHLSDPYYQH